jgi:hypothetical protein
MKDRKFIVGVWTVVTLAAWLWLYFFFTPRPPAIDRSAHELVGKLLASEAVKSLEPGARIIVFARAPEPFQVPASFAEFKSFAVALKGSGHSISVTNLLKLDPLRVPSVPPGDFFEVLRAARENDVIVSFLGPPLLNDEQILKLGGKHPRVLALCSAAMPEQTSLPKLFEQKLLAAAVVSANESRGLANRDQFRLVTSANVSGLKSKAEAN